MQITWRFLWVHNTLNRPTSITPGLVLTTDDFVFSFLDLFHKNPFYLSHKRDQTITHSHWLIARFRYNGFPPDEGLGSIETAKRNLKVGKGEKIKGGGFFYETLTLLSSTVLPENCRWWYFLLSPRSSAHSQVCMECQTFWSPPAGLCQSQSLSGRYTQHGTLEGSPMLHLVKANQHELLLGSVTFLQWWVMKVRGFWISSFHTQDHSGHQLQIHLFTYHFRSSSLIDWLRMRHGGIDNSVC
jgi:hypothetical protein